MRSEDKGRRIVESVSKELQKLVSFVIVEDVAAEGAFDTVSQVNR